MKKSIIALGLALASAACFSVQAENHGHTHLSAKHMAENDLSIGYVSYDVDGTSLTGAQISHGKQYDSGVYLRGGFEYASKSIMGGTLKMQDIVATTGKQFTIDSASLFYVEGAVHFMKASYGGFSETATEIEVGAGYKRALTHGLAMTVGGSYMESEFAGVVGLRYSFNEKMAMSVDYTKAKDVTKTGVNLNVYF